MPSPSTRISPNVASLATMTVTAPVTGTPAVAASVAVATSVGASVAVATSVGASVGAVVAGISVGTLVAVATCPQAVRAKANTNITPKRVWYFISLSFSFQFYLYLNKLSEARLFQEEQRLSTKRWISLRLIDD